MATAPPQNSHSHRYFVCRGHALCYYERSTDDSPQASGLRGVIDLRQVKRVRPSADASAPDHALDIIRPGRTYVVVPQPATAEERVYLARVDGGLRVAVRG